MSEASVTFIDAAGQLHDRVPLDRAGTLPLETCLPIRAITGHRNETSIRGRYWFSKTGRHVVYESRLEFKNLVLLDFDLEVAAVATQPIELNLPEQKPIFPDFFVRLCDGRARLCEVKPASKLDKPDVRRKLQAVASACDAAGWGWAVLTEPPPTLLKNLLFLHCDRNTPGWLERYAKPLLTGAAAPTAIGQLVEAVGPPALVRPVLLHLLWTQQLVADLHTAPLSDSTLVIQAAQNA